MYHSEFDVATFETARDALRAFAERFGMLLRIGGETHRYVEAMTVQQAPGPQTNLITVVGGSGAAYEAITLIQALDEPPRYQVHLACAINDDAYAAAIAQLGFMGR